MNISPVFFHNSQNVKKNKFAKIRESKGSKESRNNNFALEIRKIYLAKAKSQNHHPGLKCTYRKSNSIITTELVKEHKRYRNTEELSEENI